MYKTKHKIKKSYWGILRFVHVEHPKKNINIEVFEPEQTYSDCCCAEEGFKLYDTRKDAERASYDERDLIVRYDTFVYKPKKK